jgi:muramoyltetrapeptide carboxypeptidase
MAQALNAAPKARRLIKPKALKPGDTVGLITPATRVPDLEAFETIDKNLTSLGLKYKWAGKVERGMPSSYIAGPPEERLDDLHAMFADAEVAAVFTVRGGYGSSQLLDRIDYARIRKQPKILLGYSDITAMHLGVHQLTGLVTLHGPSLNSVWTDYTREHLRRALFETKPLGVLRNPEGVPVKVIRPGVARGRLFAGNLSLITNLMGTPYEIDTRGKILCLEDVAEDPFRLDRMITQLRLAGKLDQAAGIVWGECRDCIPKTRPPHKMEEIEKLLAALKIPVLGGLRFGHTTDQMTLPLGVMAKLDVAAGTIELEEAALVESRV